MILKAVLKEMADRKMKSGELGKMAKISRQQLKPWLNGITKLNEVNLLKIMEALDFKITKEY